MALSEGWGGEEGGVALAVFYASPSPFVLSQADGGSRSRT